MAPITYQSQNRAGQNYYSFAPGSKRSRYQSEYNNPNTAPERKSMIDKAWGGSFSFNPKADPNLYSSKQTEWMNEKNPARKERMRLKWGFTEPAAQTPAATPPAPQAPVDTTALFPSIRAFEPKNYEGSPLYQFQKDQGTKSLARLYAANGLGGSGAEIEGNSRFLNQLGAQEAQRAQEVSETEADRLLSLMRDESARRERSGNEQWDRLYGISSLLLSQNPMRELYDAASGSADRATNLGSSVGQLYSSLASMVPQIAAGAFSGGGGGGGSSGYFPSQPNTSAIDLNSWQANTNYDNSIMNSIINGLAGMFK